ncbi:TSC22 domain family protein 3 isoform X2 [Cyprinus carpio]|uniref:TSC22 domain family protein 3 isoform X2 n=1 Tax=Cyprinus carpio TaxID=7962 RepID=A0A9Q9YTT5_CYPCA|nr:TSC22 domain family protein 3 isoform X2 [Cyprinus carpio]XP_042626265.1 TSC22 domain family protein 3 isoform X2 [Cyprinus carpio]XP_042626266.1 TSC22 domain family protein 3 isoform X2 [Cyprinus carpio]
MSNEECRSPIGLDCCSCCLDLANGCQPEPGREGHTSLGSPTSVNHFRQLRDQLHFQNLNKDKLNNIMRQDSLESVVRDPCYLLNEGICNSNIDQTMLSILLFFHRQVSMHVQQLSWQDARVPEVGRPLTRLVASRRHGSVERGAGRSFSRLLTKPYPLTATGWWGRCGPSFPL